MKKGSYRSRPFNSKCIPENFLNDPIVKKQIDKWIQNIKEFRKTRDSIEKISDEFIEIYKSEMKKKLKSVDGTKKACKHINRTTKPWWNENLSKKFTEYVKAEKTYLESQVVMLT